MKKITNLFILLFIAYCLQSCWFYSFTGASIGANVKTIQIDYFPNNAPLVEPTLSNEFTTDLQDLFLRQTNLSLVKSGGDLQFEGEITGYRIEPTTATAEQTAAQNRLTITVNVRFYNNKNEEDNFEKKFSHYYDYPGSELPTGGQLETAFDEILERITEDIFNASVAKW